MENTKNGEHTFWGTFNQYKSLLRELTRKNIKLKYRDSVLGIFWSFVQPLLNMAVLSVVFSSLFGRRGITCYPVFLFTGRLLFEFFTTSTKAALVSFRTNAAIIKKVYVPKYIYPLSSILSTFVNLSISLVCFVCVWIFFRFTGIQHGNELILNWHALLFFIPLILLLVFTAGVGLILSVLQVYFRDIKYMWDVFCTLLFYIVPIIYSIDIIQSKWTRLLIEINPIYHMIELFRQCVYYCTTMDINLLFGASAWSFGTLLIGIWIFNKKSDDLIFHM